MVATEKIQRPHSGAARKDRSRNDSIFSIFHLACNQLAQRSPETGAQQTRFFDLGSAESDDALGPQGTRGEEFAVGDDILIPNVPDDFGRSNRIEQVNMRAGQTKSATIYSLWSQRSLWLEK